MKKYFIVFYFLFFGTIINGQSNTFYEIDAELYPEAQTLIVKQKIKFKNSSKLSLDKLFLEDWSNSYTDNTTKLAKRLSDEYSRSFTFSKKKQKGFTSINKIDSEHIKEWQRTSDNDIIEIKLSKPLEPNESVEIYIDYSIKLPDSKFTGYGYDNSNFYLKNWIIIISSLNQTKWAKQSNLNLDDQSVNFSDYSIIFKIGDDYKLFSNLDKLSEDFIGNQKLIALTGVNKRDIKINILKDDMLLTFENKGVITETDIFKFSSISETQSIYNRISEFITDYLPFTNKSKILATKSDYELSPFYGLNQLPNFLSPFPQNFLEEIIFLKSFTQNYLNSIVELNRREFHWIYKGLEIFLIDKYIKEFYPKAKFIGYFSGNRFIKNYEISKLNFSDHFLNYSEYVQRLNIHQADFQSSDKLTRINEEIASPYHSGVGLIYLESLLGEDQFKLLIRNIINVKSDKELYQIFSQNHEYNLEWFLKDYIGKRQSIDLYIKKANKDLFRISEKNNIKIPYSIGLIKNDSIIYSEKFNLFKEIELPKLDYDYVAINPDIKIPELNQNNNWIYKPNSQKPIRLRLIGDIDDPKKRNIYIRPEVTYNLYDGISPGINILNKGLKNKPFTFEIFSQYASNADNLVGGINLKYLVNNEIVKNYSTIYNIQYTTNHYDENLRYHVFFPSITLNFRDNKNLRSNILRTFSISNYTIKKESNDSNKFLNDYSIYNLSHSYSDINIIKYLRTSLNTQLSSNFGKVNFVFDYRKLLDSNRQFQARFYFGKFLWNKNRDNTYFNYNLSRSGDYLFNGNYIGRSEEEGLFSQQFIMAGGGFKSFFENPSTNNFIVSTNLNFGIWKWFESYLDLGILKDKDKKSRYFYGTGIRLNLLPDFFEIYFPVSSNNGFEISQKNYTKKIRFIVTYNLESLGKLFTRRWL